MGFSHAQEITKIMENLKDSIFKGVLTKMNSFGWILTKTNTNLKIDKDEHKTIHFCHNFNSNLKIDKDEHQFKIWHKWTLEK